MTISEFRKQVKREFPHVKASVHTTSFRVFGFDDAKCLTVTGDRPGDLQAINAWAKEANIIPDKSMRIEHWKENENHSN